MKLAVCQPPINVLVCDLPQPVHHSLKSAFPCLTSSCHLFSNLSKLLHGIENVEHYDYSKPDSDKRPHAPLLIRIHVNALPIALKTMLRSGFRPAAQSDRNLSVVIGSL